MTRSESFPGLAHVPPSRRGGGGGSSMHTLAVLRLTNCFSLRQISCKSRLRRQHCPGLPGRRDGRQADGLRGRDGGRGGGGLGSGACIPEVPRSRMEKEGEMEEAEDEGGAPRRMERNEEREKSSNTSRVPLPPVLSSSIVQAEYPPLPPSYPQKPHCYSAPSLHHPLPALRSPLCPRACPSFLTCATSLCIARQKSGGKMKLYKEGGKKINNTDG